MDITVPPNTTATVYVPVLSGVEGPAADVKNVTVNGQAVDAVPDVRYMKSEGGRVLLQAPSGRYEIAIKP